MDNRVDSVLSIRYPGHTRLWTGGGASAGSEIGWLTSGWTPPTRFLPIRIEDPLAMPIGEASASGLIILANQILVLSLLKTGLRSRSRVGQQFKAAYRRALSSCQG